jgi:hypothetical protein
VYVSGSGVDHAPVTMPISGDGRSADRALYGRRVARVFRPAFPHGFGDADVLAEIAPEGWDQSPLLACFHPSVEQRHEEAGQLHRNIEALRNARGCQDSNAQGDESSSSEPTLEEIRREYRPTPID